jgi:hypothetical protein
LVYLFNSIVIINLVFTHLLFTKPKGNKMKTLNKVLLILLTSTSLQSFADSGASQNTSAASKHSVLAASHGTVASAKLGSAVIAIPLIIVGAIGDVSLKAGNELLENALSTMPLEITEKTITAAPSPAQMMKVDQQEKL